jgi:hypothetical protein
MGVSIGTVPRRRMQQVAIRCPAPRARVLLTRLGTMRRLLLPLPDRSGALAWRVIPEQTMVAGTV